MSQENARGEICSHGIVTCLISNPIFLSKLENLLSLEPESANTIMKEVDILQWVMDALTVKVLDTNICYAVELLSILLQSSKGNWFGFGILDDLAYSF